ncbi:lytic murein transglycosylase [Brucella neotomae]|nr:lytic murein transglycosylase [Brucella neotomae]KFJ57988.1 lytic murein transglycosylase family protein [Brucella neotomae 5K33]SPU71184.1 lytic murein transglycosylase [Brucella neotomae]SPU71256.1 lytic murein transglycosylase [Brucella neotomae]SUW61162.1 lytic murein transglycosylase [Brucella neotomae]
MLRFPFTPEKKLRIKIAATVALAIIGASLSAGTALADAGFRQWIANFRPVAIKSGIAPSTFDRAFRGVNEPDPVVLEKARKWGQWLQRIEHHYSVDRHILLAIWSMESNYGEILKRDDVMRDAIRSLATLAYADARRAKYGRTQLIAAMKILQTGDIERGHLSGSWAGALGHTQFIPTSYQAYAVDMDGNGKRDIWNSVPDALGTAANLLHRNGWQPGRTWGYEVMLPAGRKFPSGSLTIAEWQQIGLVRANGRAFPDPHEKATLKVPDGHQGPAFLMTKNFFVLKRYNNADKYALAVGLLADRIGGYQGLRQDWNRPFTPISMNERLELQTHLKALGYYDGNIDGKIGATSRAAIEAFQQRNGLEPDGHPSKEVLSILRRR